MSDQQIDELKDALRLQVTNRAISNAHTRLGLSGQISAALVALCYPVGIIVAGPIGLWAMILLAAAVAGGSLAAIRQESAAIASGDATKARRYLSPEELIEFNDAATQIQAAASKKPMGAATAPTAQESGSTAQTAPGSASADVAPVLLPVAPCALDDAAPHLLLLGRTREGKSETLKHLVGDAPTVWYVTSKHTDLIPDHWRGYRVGGPTLPEQMGWLLDQWEARFLTHLEGQTSGGEWFVIDEAVGIMRSLETKGAKRTAMRLKGFIVELVTAGAAVGGYVGLLSQTGNSGPLGIDLDLLKNFSVVSCGKRKKKQAIAAFEKLTELRLTPEQTQQVLTMPGYVQLWENDGPCLSQVEPSKLPTKQVEKCPILDTPTAPSMATEPTEPKPLEARILDYLRGHGEAKTAREIRNSCTQSTDTPRASTEDMKLLLDSLITGGQIQRWEDGSTDRYQATGTGEV